MMGETARTKGGLVLTRSPTVEFESLQEQHKALAAAARDVGGCAILIPEGAVFTAPNLSNGSHGDPHAVVAALRSMKEAGYAGGISAVFLISEEAKNGDYPEPLCDDCSRRILVRFEKYLVTRGESTDQPESPMVISSNESMNRFLPLPLSSMFAYRNLPAGEITVDVRFDLKHTLIRTNGGLLIPQPSFVHYSDLTPSDIELLDVATEKALPYGHNSVDGIKTGSAIRMSNGTIYTGANFKSERTLRGMHCEENAVGSAEREGNLGGIAAVATVSDRDHIKLVCDFCSAMLVRIAAETGVNTRIILSNADRSEVSVMHIGDMFAARRLPKGVELERGSDYVQASAAQ